MNKLALYTGVDLLFEKNFFIHQPTIKEISKMFSESDFMSVLQVCIKDTDSFKMQSPNINNLIIFYALMATPDLVSEDIKDNVRRFLNCLFPDCEIKFLEQGLVLCKKDSKDILILDNDKFTQFQSILKEMFCTAQLFSEKDEKEEEEFNPIDERAKAIAELINKNRKKVADTKAQHFKDTSLIGNYLEILSVGMGIPISELIKNTLFQLLKIFHRFSDKQSFDIDFKCRLAGAKGDQPLKSWMTSS